MDTDPNAPVIVLRAPTRRQCQERALVLQAQQIPFRIRGDGYGFDLLVPASHADLAREELYEYEEENVDWPPYRPAPPVLSRGRVGAALWATVLIAIHPGAQKGFFGRDIWNAGMLKAGRILDGEWYRTATALTLHGDVAHLASNLVSGIAFLILSSHTLGGGLALLGTVLAGVLGNVANALLQEPEFRAIGASTAVFGAVGLQASYEWVRRKALGLTRIRRWAPLMAAAALLGYLGMGGGTPETVGNTDVVAHVTGFLAGLLLGTIAGVTKLPDRIGSRGQRVCGIATGVILAGAWTWALV